MKKDATTFSNSLYSFKLNLIQQKSKRVALCNKISISSYSSNIDPQTSRRMFMSDFHSNLFRKPRLRWIKCKTTFYHKKWFDSQNSNCNTKTAFCNKLPISHYSVFLHPRSLRFENIVKRETVAMKNVAKTFLSSLYSFNLTSKSGFFVIKFHFHRITLSLNTVRLKVYYYLILRSVAQY